MWRNLIQDFGIREYPSDNSVLFKPNKFRAYNLLSREHESLGFNLRRVVLNVSYFLARAASLARAKVWQFNVAGMGSGHLALNPVGLRWLKQLGLYDEYKKFCDIFDLTPHNSSAIKSFYISSIISPYLAQIEHPSVLEIGGGFGNLAAMLQFRNSISKYVIVDLPEMLLHSSLALQALYPEIPAYFLYPGSDGDTEKNGFYFCTPDRGDALAQNSFDFACNIDSFQEMTEQQVSFYIQLVQSSLRRDGFFLNVNRRKLLEAERFDNNPLLYPYDQSNRILRWETDLFMDRTLNYDHVRLDSWILRLEQIRK